MKINNLGLIMVQRSWQAVVGICSSIIIALYLTQEQQGWYFTFISLAAFYSFFEMGLGITLVQISYQILRSKGWNNEKGFNARNQKLFFDLNRTIYKIYFYQLILFFLIIFFVGLVIFKNKSESLINYEDWINPWIFITVITTISMIPIPYLSIWEGIGHIRQVYTLKLIQGVVGAAFCWIILIWGDPLWAASMMPLAVALTGILFILRQNPKFFSAWFRINKNSNIDWKKEIFPTQSRVGIEWVSLFLMSQLATPILFIHQGAIVAGKFALSLTIAHMLGIISQSWITNKVPTMSYAVVEKNWIMLRKIFVKNTILSILTYLIGAAILIILYKTTEKYIFEQRIVSLSTFILLLGFVLFYLINTSLASQLRAFRRESLAWIFLTGGILIVLNSWYVASAHSDRGVALVMFIVESSIIFPISFILWIRYNKKWSIN